MSVKKFSMLLPSVITLTYVIGFIYDTSFLEKFGIAYYELLGSPLDYLTIGGMYILEIVSRYSVVIIIALGLIGITYSTIQKHVYPKYKSYLPDMRNFSAVLIGSIPLFIFPLLLVALSGFDDAKEVKKQTTDVLCTFKQNEEVCLKGTVLRYREAKVIFFSSDNRTMIFPDKVISSVSSEINVNKD